MRSLIKVLYNKILIKIKKIIILLIMKLNKKNYYNYNKEKQYLKIMNYYQNQINKTIKILDLMNKKLINLNIGKY